MGDLSIIKLLSKETKALIIINEFEARKMPIFQIREVLEALVKDEEESRAILAIVENDLKATGFHPKQIMAFLQDLMGQGPETGDANLRITRRLKSPFSKGFEEMAPGLVGSPGASLPVPPPPPPPPTRPVSDPALPAVFLPTQGQRVSPMQPPPDLPKPKVPVSGLTQTIPPPPAMPSPKKGVSQVYFGPGPNPNLKLDGKPRVLLADDDKRIRIVFRLCLERIGCMVVEAPDGNEAWKRLTEEPFSLALLDMKMPGLHGLEVLSRMADRRMDIPVIVCSAYDQLKDEFVVATYPKLRYLVKPVATEALEGTVRELLNLPTPK